MKSLYSEFEKSVKAYPNNPAIVIDDSTYTYSELFTFVNDLHNLIIQSHDQVIALLTSRSIISYAGVLAILKANKTYLPLSSQYPPSRISDIINLAKTTTLVVGKECLDLANKTLNKNDKINTIIVPGLSKQALSAYTSFRKHHIITDRDYIIKYQNIYNETGKSTPPNQYAYLMFTSGSTGIPKGVAITHENIVTYLENIKMIFDFNQNDKFSQAADLTFDMSIHDMFVCWSVGGALYPVPQKSLMAPAKFIKDNDITTWKSVPSIANIMKKLGMLKSNIFPNLRYSIFGGAPLSVELVRDWQNAAPNSVVAQSYGLTETSVALFHYKIDRGQKDIRSYTGIVSLGSIFSDHKYKLIDDDGKTVQTGISDLQGELCLAGKQIANGYWLDIESSRQKFFSDDSSTIWFRTGDLVRVDKSEHLYYVGRKDHQVKVSGHRVELNEINYTIQQLTNTEVIVSIPYPLTNGTADSIYTFMQQNNDYSESDILSHCMRCLPEYMVPQRILFVKSLPYNNNGKVDWSALVNYLEENKQQLA